MQAILIANDSLMREKIVTGDKKITIRRGKRDYKIGPVMLCCHLEPFAILADITEVRQTTLREVKVNELQDDGFTNHVDLLQGLREYYPNMSLSDNVTVVRWENPRGKLVIS